LKDMGNFKNTGSDAKQCLQAISLQRQFLALTLAVGLILLTAPVSHAGILNLAWDAPTTNEDGSELTDLSLYRIYISFASGPCPSGPFLEVSSSTSSPSGTVVVNYTLSGLDTGTTYFVQVTAVNTSGNESACSNEASGPAKDDNSLTASTSATTSSSSSGSGGSGGGGGGCFIATAAYGSPLAPQVQLLREVRDRYLLRNPVGRAFIALYYRLSPPVAEIIARSETLRAAVRVGLMPLLWWAALTLWSPAVGLAVLIAALSLAAWLIRWIAHLVRNFQTADTNGIDLRRIGAPSSRG
jgi:hypothetical protein